VYMITQSPDTRRKTPEKVTDMLREVIVKESNYDLWYSPVVEKANSGEYGFAVNYRKLKKVIKPKAFPLQCFSDLLHSISESHAQYFTSFDLGIAFWHVSPSESSK
ncbi:hypothetical protein MAR_034376, partial [Mya arenaria]